MASEAPGRPGGFECAGFGGARFGGAGLSCVGAGVAGDAPGRAGRLGKAPCGELGCSVSVDTCDPPTSRPVETQHACRPRTRRPPRPPAGTQPPLGIGPWVISRRLLIGDFRATLATHPGSGNQPGLAKPGLTKPSLATSPGCQPAPSPRRTLVESRTVSNPVKRSFGSWTKLRQRPRRNDPGRDTDRNATDPWQGARHARHARHAGCGSRSRALTG